MKKYQKPSVKVLCMEPIANDTTGSASGDFVLDERGVYDVYAPLVIFD